MLSFIHHPLSISCQNNKFKTNFDGRLREQHDVLLLGSLTKLDDANDQSLPPFTKPGVKRTYFCTSAQSLPLNADSPLYDSDISTFSAHTLSKGENKPPGKHFHSIHNHKTDFEGITNKNAIVDQKKGKNKVDKNNINMHCHNIVNENPWWNEPKIDAKQPRGTDITNLSMGKMTIDSDTVACSLCSQHESSFVVHQNASPSTMKGRGTEKANTYSALNDLVVIVSEANNNASAIKKSATASDAGTNEDHYCLPSDISDNAIYSDAEKRGAGIDDGPDGDDDSSISSSSCSTAYHGFDDMSMLTADSGFYDNDEDRHDILDENIRDLFIIEGSENDGVSLLTEPPTLVAEQKALTMIYPLFSNDFMNDLRSEYKSDSVQDQNKIERDEKAFKTIGEATQFESFPEPSSQGGFSSTDVLRLA